MIINFKRTYIYYIIGIVVTVVIFGLNKGYFLFLLLGFGVGILLHNWVKDMYDNTINAFFTDELRKRQMKKKVLEQELERLKEGD
jgi:uncharacterized metal-binding protein